MLTKEELEEAGVSESPFGKSAVKVFSTSQALTAFGAAMGKMKDWEIIELKDIPNIVEMLQNKHRKGYEWLTEMLLRFDRIKSTSKKIGNAQRMFLHYFFRELLNKDSESYLNLQLAVENGYRKYNSQVN